jgi:lysophospholipase L1-like esterase
MYGTNDSHIDVGKETSRLAIDKYEANLHEIIKKLRKAKIKPVLMTEPRMTNSASAKENEPYKNNDMNFKLREYVDICRKVAKEEKVDFVDHFQVWTENEKSGQDLDEWLTDGVHPNPKGHKKMAETILPVIRKIIGEQ